MEFVGWNILDSGQSQMGHFELIKVFSTAFNSYNAKLHQKNDQYGHANKKIRWWNKLRTLTAQIECFVYHCGILLAEHCRTVFHGGSTHRWSPWCCSLLLFKPESSCSCLDMQGPHCLKSPIKSALMLLPAHKVTTGPNGKSLMAEIRKKKYSNAL